MSSLEEFNRQHAVYQLQFELPTLPLQEAIAHALKVLPPLDYYGEARVDEAVCEQLDELITRAWVDPPSDDAIKLTAYCSGVVRRSNSRSGPDGWVMPFGRVIDSQHMPALQKLVGQMCDMSSLRLRGLFDATSKAWGEVSPGLRGVDGPDLSGVEGLVPVRDSVAAARRQTLVAVFAGLSSKHKTVVYDALFYDRDKTTLAKWMVDNWIGPDDARLILSVLAKNNDHTFGDGKNLELLEIIQKDDPDAVLPDEVRDKFHQKPRAFGERSQESLLERSSRSSREMKAFIRRQLRDVEPEEPDNLYTSHGNPVKALEKMAAVSGKFTKALQQAEFGGDPNRKLNRDLAELIGDYQERTNMDIAPNDDDQLRWGVRSYANPTRER